MKSKILVIVFLLSAISILGQDKSIQLGSSSLNSYRTGGFFDYSDPVTLNIKVAVWGNVRYPGKYIVPEYSTVLDLLSYSGGPTKDADLNDLRLFRMNKDSTDIILKFNYDDLMWQEDLKSVVNAPALKADDILIVPGGKRYFFRDNLAMGLSILSALISLAILLR